MIRIYGDEVVCKVCWQAAGNRSDAKWGIQLGRGRLKFGRGTHKLSICDSAEVERLYIIYVKSLSEIKN